MRLLLASATIGVTLFVALAPGVAAAGSPNTTQYGNPGSSEPTETETDTNAGGTLGGSTGSGPGSQGTTGGTLPFTGQDLALVIGLGALLVVAGLGLRVVGRTRRAS